MTEPTYDYAPPVSKLLTMGDVRKQSEWADYRALGLANEHVPELTRMALDEELHQAISDTLEVWAPLHAWRALAQLRAEAAIEPLLELLHRVDEYDDDWTSEELPIVFGQIGAAAMTPLAKFLADPVHGPWARAAAADSFTHISRQHPQTRDRCVTTLARQLEQFKQVDHTLNAFIISSLIDLKAVETAPVMERAFAAGRVDLSVTGDWEEVQIALGLLQERLTPEPGFFFGDPVTSKLQKMLKKWQQARHQAKLKAQTRAKAQAKTKRKQQKKARKQKRKRR